MPDPMSPEAGRATPPLAVSWFFRCPGAFHSIEELFATVAGALPADVAVTRRVAPCAGAAPLALWRNLRWARGLQGQVNHITGDVHYLAAALDPRRTVLTIHDLRLLDHPSPWKRALLRLLWVSLPVRRVRCVTVISEATRRELLKVVSIPERRLRVIPDCLAPEFTFTPQAFNATRPTILQVGTTDNKNLLRLAVALRGLGCRLQILGKPTREQEDALKSNGIDFTWATGLSRAAVVELYRHCDLLCFVSTCEGFGLPVIEAQAVGRPVITSNVSSLPEVAGDAALLVDPYDVEAIRAAVRRVIAEPLLRADLIAKGQVNVARFKTERIAALYATLYAEIANENGAITHASH